MTSASSIVRLSRKASKPWLWWFHLVVLLTVIQFQAQASSSSIECILLATLTSFVVSNLSTHVHFDGLACGLL